MVRLIKAFPVKMELHIVDGYVYRYKRAAGGAAQFLNSLVNQLAQKCYHNHCIYHALKVRELGVSDPEVLFARLKQVTFLIACVEHVRLLIACVKHFGLITRKLYNQLLLSHNKNVGLTHKYIY
jgi:hypothetical protein